MPSKSRPDSCTRLSSFDELSSFARAFSEGLLNLLVVLGPPGVGKSQTLRYLTGDKSCWISGSATPFGIYVEAYRYQDRQIVLDDVDGLMRDRQGVRLLKALCQTDPKKKVSWQSHAAALAREGIPQSFVTSSPVAIIANAWFDSVDVRALEDRGHVIEFDPPPLEVHQQAAKWFWDQEVFDFVADNLHLIAQHSLRTYVTAWERKRAGLAWKSLVFDRCLSGTAREVAILKADPEFTSEEERVREFVRQGFGCRATYFNYAKQLKAVPDVPRILLLNHAPPAADDSPPSLIEILKRRHRGLGQG